MSHILNHSYPFYSGGNFEPYATVLYKRDNILVPSSWMDTQRNFHHVITNSNGDSIITIEEKNLSLNTADYYDSYYRIYVEAFDQSGNSTIDSMDVYFNNGISSVNDLVTPSKFVLYQNYPNPFNPVTDIKYAIGSNQFVQLKVYDVLGRVAATLVNEFKPAGIYQIKWNAEGLSSGIYFYQLKTDKFTETRKMLYLR